MEFFRPQLVAQFFRALFREEHSGTPELDPPRRTGDRVGQLVRPLHIEEDIARAPHDERRGLQILQLRFHAHRLPIIEPEDETFQF